MFRPRRARGLQESRARRHVEGAERAKTKAKRDDSSTVRQFAMEVVAHAYKVVPSYKLVYNPHELVQYISHKPIREIGAIENHLQNSVNCHFPWYFTLNHRLLNG